MDALSEVLKALRLSSGIFLEAEFTSPWCINSAPVREDWQAILPNAEHVALYHLLTEGVCRTSLDGGKTVELQVGDVILFPRCDSHFMGSDLRLPPVPVGNLVMPAMEGGLMRIHHGGGGPRTRFVCGFLDCDSQMCKPLLDALPSMLHVPLSGSPAAGWIIDTMRRGADERRTPRVGADAVLAKMSELLFVEAIRAYVEALPSDQRGWFAALRDLQISRVLALMHAHPQKSWTVDELARDAGISRSALAERFAQLLGEPPMQYLTRWRLALATRTLRQSRSSVAHIAEQVGYDSGAAFNRAFKREFGEPPAAWRRKHAAMVT